MSTPAASDKNSPYFQAIVPAFTQVKAYTNSAADIAYPFQQETTIVEIFCTTDAWILIKVSTSSANATAISTASRGDSFFCPGGIVRFVGLPFTKGVQYTISVVRSTADGTLYVSEGA